MTRDSAGVTIYESSILGPTIDVIERLRIGAIDGPPETTFNRIAAARLGPAGLLVILDRGDHLIKVLDSVGTLIRTIGGEGEGPAEFQAPTTLTVSGDTLWVLDWRLQKIVAFDAGGALLETRRIEYSMFGHGDPVALARRPSNTFAIVGASGGCALPRRPSDNLWRLYTVDAAGAIRDTVIREESRGALGGYTANSCTATSWPFGPVHRLAFDRRGGAFHSTGANFEIVRRDTTLARVTAVLRYPGPARAVTFDEREAFANRIGERDLPNDLRRALEHAIDSAGYPETWPAITNLFVAGADTVWAQRARPASDPHQLWDVLIDGRHVGTVALPGAVRVLDVRGNRVLGVLSDDLDVQYVMVFGVPPLPNA